MAVVSHVNRRGCSQSRTLDRHARRRLLWAQDRFLSLRAVHVPGDLNVAVDFLSTQKLRSGEWMLHRQTVAQIWSMFGEAEVDLFASQGSMQCPLWFSRSHPTPLGIDAFPHLWPDLRLCIPSCQVNPCSPLQSEGVWDLPSSGSPVLVIPDVVLPDGGVPLADPCQERSVVFSFLDPRYGGCGCGRSGAVASYSGVWSSRKCSGDH